MDSLEHYPEIIQYLQSAFPRRLARNAQVALSGVPVSSLNLSDYSANAVMVAGEQVRIPIRFYSPEPDPTWVSGLDQEHRTILACVYTRHSNGFVRQNYMQTLFTVDAEWIPPFVFHLLGEYVVPILESIEHHLDSLQTTAYRSFITANPVYLHRLKCRIVSYWNCYYRTDFPRFSDYVGFRVAHRLGIWSNRDARRLLAGENRDRA